MKRARPRAARRPTDAGALTEVANEPLWVAAPALELALPADEPVLVPAVLPEVPLAVAPGARLAVAVLARAWKAASEREALALVLLIVSP
jgi:hypothetical protein